MRKDARFSACRQYRYALWRIWNASEPHVLFIGLNPSTADETGDDPTLTRCINYAASWGYGGVCMANLFAFCANRPEAMLAAADPVGPGNDGWLARLSAKAGLVVAAWGNTGGYRGRSGQVRALLPDLYCLKLNRSGEPAHPLYQKAALRPVRMCR